ncbi:MAG: response regulator [Rikenellaceae bacterium]
MRKIIFVAIALLLCISTSTGQISLQESFTSYKIEQVDESDGFLQNTAIDITQDGRGYLWCSTPNGVYKYNGYNFEIFYNDPKDDRSLDSSSILSITQWFDGRLCFTNNTTLNIFNDFDSSFHRIEIPNREAKYRFVDIKADLSNRGVVWLLSRDKISILKLTPDLEEVERVIVEVANLDNTPSATIYRKIIRDNNGYMWLLSNNEVTCNKYDEAEWYKQIFNYPIPNARSLVVDRTGQIIIYAKGQISIINHNQQYDDFDSEDIDLSHCNIDLDDLLLSADGSLIGVDWSEAVYRINLSNREIVKNHLSGVQESGRPFRYRSGYIDSSGVLWVGTLHGGLYRVNLNHKPFNSFGDLVKDSYPNQIAGDVNGNVWIGTFYNGISHANLKSGVSHDVNKKLNLSPESSIFALDFYRRYLWYSTQEGAIYRAKCDIDGSILTHEKVAETAAGLGFFYRDTQRLYYAIFNPVGSNCSIYICDDTTSSHTPTFREFTLMDGSNIAVGGVSSMIRDSRGRLWIGTSSKGLYMCDFTQDGTLKVCKKIPLPYDVEKSNIFALYEDFQNNIYIGSFGGGMMVIPPNYASLDDSYTLYTRRDGLANNAVYSIHSGGANFLWISTDEGLSRFDVANKKFLNYNTSDGVLSLNFRKWSSWKSPDGELFFGGVEGVNYFKPELIKTNVYLPNIAITSLHVGGVKQSIAPYIYYTNDIAEGVAKVDEFELQPFENSFSIEFASLHFDNPDKNQYEYMLRGVDPTWHSVSSKNRAVTYSNLAVGDYEFLVRGTNSDGIWSREYARMKIVVLPYWWQSWWAKVVYLAILMVIAYFVYLYLVQKQRHSVESKINQAKLDFFTNISHEIKTPLTIISGALDLNRGETIPARDVEIIRRNNNRMLSLVTQLLNFRKMTQGHAPFHPQCGDIVPLLGSISDSFSLLAQRSCVDFQFSTQSPQRELCFEADKIEKIVANLLSNAFKHTPNEGGKIELLLSVGLPSNMPSELRRNIKYPVGSYTTISVSDNGEGIPAEYIGRIFEQFYQVGGYNLSLKHRGVGVGLAYSKLLTELHEGYIFVESAVGVGSTFYVILPQSLTKVEMCENSGNQTVEQTNIEFVVDQKSAQVAQPNILDRHDKEVLIVEDNHEIREFLNKVLSPIYTVHEAENGVQGLEIAERVIPDIIISDVMMPEMDGITLCDRLKKSDKTSHIPIILLTANSSMDHRVEGLRSGADSYIPKPFNLEHLMVRIEKLLEIRSLLKSKYMQFSGLVDLEQIEIADPDKEFLARVEDLIEQNLTDSEFTVEALEQAMAYTHVQLYRKVKSISGVPVVEFIRNYRLKRSVDMMRQGGMRINEIMYSVGFATPSYYSKVFKKRYGKSPAEFMEEINSL